jgi:hypothetical protein
VRSANKDRPISGGRPERSSGLGGAQPQTQKHALTQIPIPGPDGEQPHIVLFPSVVQSFSLLHSLWQVQFGFAPGPPQPQR